MNTCIKHKYLENKKLCGNMTLDAWVCSHNIQECLQLYVSMKMFDNCYTTQYSTIKAFD